MKIVIAHNRYQQAGGEDRVVVSEMDMLASRGHQVELLDFGNDEIQGLAVKAQTALRSLYSRPAYARTLRVLRSFRPDLIHVHNYTPMLSPAVFFASQAAGIPVVHTVHNFRMVCAGAQLFRDGSVCELCLEHRSFLPGVKYGCYRGSRIGSAVVGATMVLHDKWGTWGHRIHRYIALTEFAATRLALRVPRERLRVKPNFARDVGEGSGDGGFALFVGRLSPEKGLDTIIAADAANLLQIPVSIAGAGPLLDRVREAAARPGSRLRVLGQQSAPQVVALMKAASVLLVPSLWYEGFPMVIVEALSVGLPVVASRLGSLEEIIQDSGCGILHEPGHAGALAGALKSFAAMDDNLRRATRKICRDRFATHYSEEVNYSQLTEIYSEAVAMAAREKGALVTKTERRSGPKSLRRRPPIMSFAARNADSMNDLPPAREDMAGSR